MSEIVYVWINEAMPGLMRIGTIATKQETQQRIEELRNFCKGVPLPFTCLYAAEVADASEVEKCLFEEFAGDRINPERAYFTTEPGLVIAALKKFEMTDQSTIIQEELNRMEAQEEE